MLQVGAGGANNVQLVDNLEQVRQLLGLVMHVAHISLQTIYKM